MQCNASCTREPCIENALSVSPSSKSGPTWLRHIAPPTSLSCAELGELLQSSRVRTCLCMQQRLSTCAINTLLQADLAVQRLLQFLPDRELANLSCTCLAWKQTVLQAVVPSLHDITEGLEPRPVACKLSLLIALNGVSHVETDDKLQPCGTFKIRCAPFSELVVKVQRFSHTTW